MKQLLRSGLFLSFLVFLFNSGLAQPGCPSVDAGTNVNLPCGTNCANLTANVFQVGATTSYTVGSIPYAPPFAFTGGTQLFIGDDDIWSDVINLPFTFCFYGNSYNQALIGANGVISFDVSMANNTCQWAFNLPIPTTQPPGGLTLGVYPNSINGAFHDMDPSVSTITIFPPSITYPAKINYAVLGSAPCRTFVVNYSTVPHYDCNNLRTTQQIVLYETTNVIEVYIQSKPTCSSWNSGNAVIGIQNIDGTQALAPPGRNTGPWSASNEAWRFTPNGTSIVTVEWLNGGNVVATGNTYQACPGVTAQTYTARATYTPCTGGTPVVVTDNVTVTPAGNFTGTISSTQNVSCFGGNNGSATATLTGGAPPVNYGWSTGGTNLSVSGLTAGNYTFTASDNSGCTITLPVNITQPTQVTFNPATIQNIGCSGAGNGSITANPTGGTPPYNTYNWTKSPGGQTYTGQTISNLTAGTYNVTVTDASSCTATASYNVTQVTPLSFNLTTTNVSCNGGTNGTATATVTSGTTPYQYNWNGTGNTSNSTISTLAAGTVNVTVTDANCSASASATITQPTPIVFGTPDVFNIDCTHPTGALTAYASGGNGTLTYTWTSQTGGQTYNGSSITNLAADLYDLTVTDNSNCSATITYAVTQAGSPPTYTQVITNASCNGGTDGGVAITMTSTNTPYQFNWNGTGNTTNSSISGLAAGTVNVTITDASQCSVTASFNITQPTAIVPALQNQTNVNCFGGNNGSLTVSASGGAGNYTYSWNNGAYTGASINTLTATDYILTVTDANNCSSSITYTITQPAQLVINAPTLQNVGCAGNNDGSITANVSGGTPNYTYAWSQQTGGQTYTGQTISNLSADTYGLSVYDNYQCSATASYQITQAPALTFTQSSTNVSCNGGADGTATIAVQTGTAPYQYNWNGAGNTANPGITGLAAGVVNVTITDVNCSATATFNITQPTAVTVSATNTTNVSCNGGNDGTITVTANGGTPGSGYTYTWSNQQTGTTATALGVGSYTVTAADGNGCTVSQQYSITEPAALNVSVTKTDATCYQAANGSATVTATGGTTPYAYLWTDGQTTATASALVANQYTCTVTDLNGCSTTATTLITEPSDVIIQTAAQAVKCIGDENGTIAVSASGGNPAYNYSATQDFANFVFATQDTIRDLAPGDYFVIVSDNKGCTKTVNVTVPEATPDILTIATDSTSCYGPDYNDGGASITVTSIANGAYQFSVDGSPNQYSPDFYFLSAGAHTLTATSFFGCVTTWPFVVDQPLPIIAEVNPDSLKLELGATGQVLVTYQNATDVTYAWGPAEGLSCIDCPNPYVLVYDQKDYIVTVSAVNGTATCYATANLHVDVLDHLPVFIPNSFTPNGDGNNDVFEIYGQGIKTIDLKIFNRWGELVYESNNQFSGWDGTYKGQKQLPQVFTYYATVTFLNDKEYEKGGTVTLVR